MPFSKRSRRDAVAPVTHRSRSGVGELAGPSAFFASAVLCLLSVCAMAADPDAASTARAKVRPEI